MVSLFLQVHDKGDSIVKMSTAESLAVLLILDEARVKHGFSEEQLGVSSAEAETIAHVFATYAPTLQDIAHVHAFRS